MKKPIRILILFLIVCSISASIPKVMTAEATGTIHIKPDGSVDPATTLIKRSGDVYTFTDNITFDRTVDFGILVEKGNVTIDGAHLALQGAKKSGSKGIAIGTNNVTIRNINIGDFYVGIALYGNATDPSRYNNIVGNNITDNFIGINLHYSSDNRILHNNFENNTYSISDPDVSSNTWDDGYPSGGNYWSDYNGTDLNGGPYQNTTGSDGIGDKPYAINAGSKDHYPLMALQPYIATLTVVIVSPENETYQANNVNLTCIVSDIASWIGYSLDEQASITVTENTTIQSLSNGQHNLVVYAANAYGETVVSEPAYFSVDVQSGSPAEPVPAWIVASIVIVIVSAGALLIYIRKRRKPSRGAGSSGSVQQ